MLFAILVVLGAFSIGAFAFNKKDKSDNSRENK